MCPQMIKIEDNYTGYIDLYGNDVYGLTLLLDMIIDSTKNYN